jgi:non-ribosomal peptide synthetase component F
MHYCAALVLLACASAGHEHLSPDLDISAIQEIEVKISGVSIETDFMTVPFEGQVVFRPARLASVAATQMQVLRQDPRRREPYPVSIAIDKGGRFSEQVRLMVCRMGKNEWPHWPTFIFTAPGCKDQRITLSTSSRHHRVKMSCAE